jgi:alpha-amylase
MGVLMQAFYWDCPKLENAEYHWWGFVKSKIPGLKKVGFTALWLPPASKAADNPSMGYDVYDYYDLGEFDQKGSVRTWFGSKDELIDLIGAAHDSGLQVYADLVLNHNSGGDGEEENPIDKTVRWTKFSPESQMFDRNWRCFHPSPYETWDGETFGDMPDLCHRNPYVYGHILKYVRWLVEKIGFDGFRFDFVKGYGSWTATSIQELRLKRNGKYFKPYGVGECWDSDRVIDNWLNQSNEWSDNPVGAFDFPLREKLKGMCDVYGFSMRCLVEPGTLVWDRPSEAVTFVENHDIARSDPIVNDKMLAYAFILTHEGYPCVFWQDYFNFRLGREEGADGIAALVKIHEENAGGTTSILYVDDDTYVMQRNGTPTQNGLILVINNSGNSWGGHWVQTKWKSRKFVPAAWGSHQSGVAAPVEKWTQADGWADFYAPPRGYAVYLPQSLG